MPIRRSAMTLGGKLSIGCLAVATFLFVFGGRSSEWFLTVFGFPLVYIPWVCEQAFGAIDRPRPEVGVTVGVLLWVANAYLWGHGVAAVAGWTGRRFGQGTPNPTAGHDPPP